jgi:succinyl-diaminopimelate desuccinylase
MNLSQIEKTLLELLKIDSVITTEKEISEFIAQSLKKLTLFHKISAGLCQIYHTPNKQEKRTLAFYGHLDTVKNQQEKAPYIAEEKIYGCGASDMKGGLAIMLELMQLADQGLDCPYNLIFIFYDQEEGPYENNGLEVLLDRYDLLKNCDLAFVLEPTNNLIQVGCLGGLHAEVVFQGKSAHSARPWEGDNALHKAGDLLSRLKSLSPKKVTFQNLDYFEVINATQARTNNSRNSIPADFTLNLNYRFAPGKRINEAKDELRSLVDSSCDLKFIDECPAAKIPVDNELLKKFQELHNLTYEPKQAWTDIARLDLHGIPAVNCGPGTPAQAHQKNEWILRRNLLQGLINYRTFLFPYKVFS